MYVLGIDFDQFNHSAVEYSISPITGDFMSNFIQEPRYCFIEYVIRYKQLNISFPYQSINFYGGSMMFIVFIRQRDPCPCINEYFHFFEL